MLRTTFILLLTLLFAGSAKAMTPSGRQAGDSTTGVPREVFYFSEAPKLWQQRPTISDLQGGFGTAWDEGEDYRRKERGGAVLMIVGILGGIAGIAAFTSADRSFEGIGQKLGGMLLMIMGLSVGIAGAFIYGKNHKKRMSAERQ